MTEKLYYIDSYIKEFDASVLSCESRGEFFDTVLDKTAFFPEAGGQYSDTGYIGEVYVFDVKEMDGVIHHYTKEPINVNNYVHCCLNFEERFDKMQQHTAEHLISGVLHSLYGAENTGFHLGAEEVTFDTSIPITKDMLAQVEEKVNLAIFENVRVSAYFPSVEKLKIIEYRSKLDLTENVRIVNIEGYDSCACCAPHLNYTGEIGFIKLIDSVSFHSGSRIRMLAGKRAYKYVNSIIGEAASVSVMLSSPIDSFSADVGNLRAQKEALDKRIEEMGVAVVKALADLYSGERVVCYPFFDTSMLRAYANFVSHKVNDKLIILSGNDGEIRYLVYYNSPEIVSLVKNANQALSGRGGGRAPMATGTFFADLEVVKKYFEE